MVKKLSCEWEIAVIFCATDYTRFIRGTFYPTLFEAQQSIELKLWMNLCLSGASHGYYIDRVFLDQVA